MRVDCEGEEGEGDDGEDHDGIDHNDSVLFLYSLCVRGLEGGLSCTN